MLRTRAPFPGDDDPAPDPCWDVEELDDEPFPEEGDFWIEADDDED